MKRFAMLVLGLTAIGACGGSSSTGPKAAVVASVAIVPGTLSLIVGETQQMGGTPKDATGAAVTGQTIIWTATPATVATISTGGFLTTIGPGALTITASAGGASSSIGTTIISQIGGTWSGTIGTQALTFTIAENGGVVNGTGTLTNTPTGTRAMTVAGIYSNKAFTATLSSGTTTPFNITGTVNRNTMVATLTGSGFNGDAMTLLRQ